MARRKLTEAQRRAREKRKSKKLGYSLTYARHKAERAQSRPFVERAKKLAGVVPELKTLSKKTRLTTAEKAKVTRYSKKLRNVKNLFPLSKEQAKKFKKQLFSPGVQAIALTDVSPDAKLETFGDDIIVTSNGRHWIYWKLDRETVKSKAKFGKAAQKAFDLEFPIEKIADLAAKAFKKFKVKQIHLWGASGRVGDGFPNLSSFISWLNEKWQAGRYVSIDGQKSEPAKWINGIAILLEDGSKKHAEVTKIAKSRKAAKRHTGKDKRTVAKSGKGKPIQSKTKNRTGRAKANRRYRK